MLRTSRYRVPVEQVTWTQAEEAQLRKLTGEGLSAREIGFKMNRSRNSIIGKWKRTRDNNEH